MATDGNLGGWYAVEPYASSAQIYWQVSSIRFHYPSEHTIDGTSYPLEMQIIADDLYNRCEKCSSHKGGFSIMFQVGEEESSFWTWAGTSDIQSLDLNLLFPKTSPMTTQMLGYIGSDTMPNCSSYFCWYISMPIQTITQATLDKLKSADVPYNNRATDLGSSIIYHYMNAGALYEAPVTPTSTEL